MCRGRLWPKHRLCPFSALLIEMPIIRVLSQIWWQGVPHTRKMVSGDRTLPRPAGGILEHSFRHSSWISRQLRQGRESSERTKGRGMGRGKDHSSEAPTTNFWICHWMICLSVPVSQNILFFVWFCCRSRRCDNEHCTGEISAVDTPKQRSYRHEISVCISQSVSDSFQF